MCNYESIMSSYIAKLFRGVLPVSVLFLSVCLLIYFLLPSEETESVLDSYAELANAKYSEELALEVGFKPEYLEFSNENDRGLELYRQPSSRASVEWFYTQVTGNRLVALSILENADRNNIPLSLAFSLAFVESRFKPDAVNRNSNATVDRGLFQLNSASFPHLTESEFFNPEVSAKYGMIHLRWCMDLAGTGNDVTALAMYNAGTTRVRANKTPQHTLNYVAKISAYRVKLEGRFNSDVASFFNGSQKNTSLAKK